MRRRTLLESGEKNIFDATSSNTVSYWEGGSTTITITASGDWTVWTDEDWIEIEKDSGTGDAKIWAAWNENRSYYERSGHIYVSSNGKTLSFYVVQLDYWAWTIESDAFIVLNNGGLILTGSRGSASAVIDIDANPNEQFEITEYSTFSVSPSKLSPGRNNVTISWDENTTGDCVSKVIYLQTYHRAQGGSIRDTESFWISQAYFPVTEALYVTYDIVGATQEGSNVTSDSDFDIVINANCPWVISRTDTQYNSSYIKLSKYDGFGDDVVHVSCTVPSNAYRPSWTRISLRIRSTDNFHFGYPGDYNFYITMYYD